MAEEMGAPKGTGTQIKTLVPLLGSSCGAWSISERFGGSPRQGQWPQWLPWPFADLIAGLLSITRKKVAEEKTAGLCPIP